MIEVHDGTTTHVRWVLSPTTLCHLAAGGMTPTPTEDGYAVFPCNTCLDRLLPIIDAIEHGNTGAYTGQS